MITAGIDIGSRTIKLVLVEDNKMVFSEVIENTFNTIELCKKILHDKKFNSITVTGYGRHLFAEYFKSDIISEIKAFSIGVHSQFPDIRTILDIGGQDTKAIALDDKGRVKKFEMNDKCAAGTGRFLEIMSTAMCYEINDFGSAALSTDNKENISSMCTVFAESEVISMLAKGYERARIARGIHYSIVTRSVALLNRIGIEQKIAFVGGVANNPAMCVMLEDVLKSKIFVPPDPQIIGALGCALYKTETIV